MKKEIYNNDDGKHNRFCLSPFRLKRKGTFFVVFYVKLLKVLGNH